MSGPALARRAMLVLHIVSSVGWLGAVAAYFVLDVSATTTDDAGTARAAYLAMDLTARYAVVPLAGASFLIGVVNALITPWGLIRHYWVLVKLLLTGICLAVLLLERATISTLADRAVAMPDPTVLPGTLVHSVGGLMLLSVITAISVFKPRGVTRHGWRVRQREVRAPASTS